MGTCSLVGKRLGVVLLMAFAVAPLAAFALDEFDTYHYKLVLGHKTPVCRHMDRVYNESFRRPWYFREVPIETPPFPRLPGVEYDELLALRLRFSAFPSSPEFDAVQWREGRYVGGETKKYLAPILVADLDIDNDGQVDQVVKIGFMLSIRPGGGGAPGGEDELFVLDKGQLDLSGNVTLDRFYRRIGQKRPALIHYSVLSMPVRVIRPFIYQGTTYLSAYEQDWLSAKRLRESIWVLKYRGGGGNLGGGKWEPVDAERVCRFQMIVVKQDQ